MSATQDNSRFVGNAVGRIDQGSYGQLFAGGVSFQPAFDRRMLNFPLLRAGRGAGKPGVLPRGIIYQDPTDPLNQQNGGPFGVNFLYNPTSVDVNYSLDTSQLPTNAQPLGARDIPSFIPGSATLSFGLLFDRTYECWTTSDHPGVLSDVRQFERMVGYTADSPFIQPGALYVIFGNQGLQYYGFMTGFNVTYTNWTQDMRPNRCAISGITMTVLPLNATTGQEHTKAEAVSQAGSGKKASVKPPTPGAKKNPTGRAGKRATTPYRPVASR